MLLQSLVLPQSRLELASACVFGLLTAVNYGSESGGTSAEYSKFAIETTGAKTDVHRVSGRVGMLVIYVPALFLVGALIMAGTASLVNIMLAVHFGKRALETLFVHRYSGSMPLSTASTIGVYYSLVSAAIASLPSAAQEHPEATTAGIALFAVGQLGNLYHHWLLARLRDKDTKAPSKDDRKRAYKIPQGGLFPLVAMPHYLFELVAWLGVATTSQHLNAFLVFTSMCSYLAGRAQATSRWNVANIPGYPAERRSLVPGIF